MNWWDDVPITEVFPRLFVGGYIQASRLAQENPSGIQAVLDVSTDAPWEEAPPYVEAPGIVYAHIPFHDGEEIPDQKLWDCLQFLAEQHSRHANRVLVHCAAGISRSVTITAAFMHSTHIMDFTVALDYIKQRRPVANPAPAVLVSAKKILRIWPYDGSFGS
jgi:hypothetical protein